MSGYTNLFVPQCSYRSSKGIIRLRLLSGQDRVLSVLSFSELGAIVFHVNCAFLHRNPYLKLTAVQRKQYFCASSGLCFSSSVDFPKLSTGGKADAPFHFTLKTFSHVTGQPKLRGFSLQPSQPAACAVQLFPALPEQRDCCFSGQPCSHT